MTLASLLDRLLGNRRVVDPVFGPLRWVKGSQFWEGETLFQPTGRVVDLLVQGGPEEPTARQRAVLGQLASRWEALLPEVVACLDDYGAAPEAVAAGLAELDLVVIDIQSEDPAAGTLELTLERNADGRIYSVLLEGWAPRQITADALPTQWAP